MGGSRLDRKIKEYEQGIEEANTSTKEKREQLKTEFYNYDKMLREIKKEQTKQPMNFKNKEFWEDKTKILISLMDGVRRETIYYDKQLAWRMNERLKQRKTEFSIKTESKMNNLKIEDINNKTEESQELER